MNIRFESQLKNTIASGLKSLYQLNVEASSIILQETKKEFEGDVTLVVFPYTKTSGKSP